MHSERMLLLTIVDTLQCLLLLLLPVLLLFVAVVVVAIVIYFDHVHMQNAF